MYLWGRYEVVHVVVVVIAAVQRVHRASLTGRLQTYHHSLPFNGTMKEEEGGRRRKEEEGGSMNEE